MLGLKLEEDVLARAMAAAWTSWNRDGPVRFLLLKLDDDRLDLNRQLVARSGRAFEFDP